MKTPEEIKQACKLCITTWVGNHYKTCDINCPYVNEGGYCRNVHNRDTLAYIQQLEKRVPRWISVEERLPESGKHVLAAVRFSGQYSRGGYVCDGFFARKFSISSKFGDELAYEYCAEKDEYCLEEGWYEVIKNWDDYDSVAIADRVTHWMPLPEPPEEGEHATD